MGKEEQAAQSRKMLMSLLHGGDGHTADWIEGVVYEATPTQPEVPAYMLHNYNKDGVEVSIFQSICEEYARNMYLLLNDAGSIEDTTITPQALDERKAAIPITDTGRRIAEPQQCKRFDTLTFLTKPY